MVTSALRGKRGQAFLCELIEALDALPEKKLIVGQLEQDGCHCAFGAVGRKRGVDMRGMTMDEDGGSDKTLVAAEDLAAMFNVAECMAQEVMYENDEGGRHDETPEWRWQRMRRWAETHLIEWSDNS
jgi:hypothetical protein